MVQTSMRKSFLLFFALPFTGLAHASDCVVLLHGLARSSSSMHPMQQALEKEGFATANIDYPSRKHEVEELANIAIRDDYRGRGLGARLLEHVLKTAEAKGVRSLYLEVRPSNERALKLYRARGFREIGVRRSYYDRPPEDALVLCLKIGQGIGAA